MQIIRNLVGVFKWFLLHGELHSRSFEISLNRTYSNAVVINDFVLEKCCVAWSDQWRTFSLVSRGLLFRMEHLRTRKLTLKDTVIPKRDIWILFFAWNERNVDISIIPGFFVQRSFKILRVVQMKYFVSPSALCSSRRRFKPLSCQEFPLVPLYHVSLFSGTGSRYAFCLFRFVGLAKNAMSEFQEKNNEQQEGRSHPRVPKRFRLFAWLGDRPEPSVLPRYPWKSLAVTTVEKAARLLSRCADFLSRKERKIRPTCFCGSHFYASIGLTWAETKD